MGGIVGMACSRDITEWTQLDIWLHSIDRTVWGTLQLNVKIPRSTQELHTQWKARGQSIAGGRIGRVQLALFEIG
jgi:hypothetical protein